MIKKIIAILFLPYIIFGQGFQNLDLNDMSAFREQAGNWKIVSDVKMNRLVDVHKDGNGSISISEGKGILINLNNDKMKSALLTQMEHGDIDLELDFMMPKGSNSGIYLMGRYEIQLYDSWGVTTPSFSDLGGIYRNWESNPTVKYMGKAPMTNPALAPGLWQKMEISFKAPQFDGSGNKIKNATINFVKINGTIIHENVEIPKFTGGPIVANEVSKGPLMIQGDHGAVAFKNIKYKLREDAPSKISNVTYKLWEGNFNDIINYKDLAPKAQGNSPEGITWKVANTKNDFAIKLTGDLEIQTEDEYAFSFKTSGKVALFIDGMEVYKPKSELYPWTNAISNRIPLKSGKHKIEFYLNKITNWVDPKLAMFAEGKKVSKHSLHNFSSYIESSTKYPLYVNNDKPTILRAFLDFEDNNKLRRTHTIAVGNPNKVNYIFDNANGALSCIWKGEFIDASPMWFDRGDGSFYPASKPIYLFNESQFRLNDKSAKEAELDNKEFRSRGYSIMKENKFPIFNYEIFGMKVNDKILQETNESQLTRTITIKEKIAGAEYIIAKGKSIDKQVDGSYNVDGKYYIGTSQNDVTIKSSGGMQYLVSSLATDQVVYTLIW
jgi:hypothetical protein